MDIKEISNNILNSIEWYNDFIVKNNNKNNWFKNIFIKKYWLLIILMSICSMFIFVPIIIKSTNIYDIIFNVFMFIFIILWFFILPFVAWFYFQPFNNIDINWFKINNKLLFENLLKNIDNELISINESNYKNDENINSIISYLSNNLNLTFEDFDFYVQKNINFSKISIIWTKYYWVSSKGHKYIDLRVLLNIKTTWLWDWKVIISKIDQNESNTINWWNNLIFYIFSYIIVFWIYWIKTIDSNNIFNIEKISALLVIWMLLWFIIKIAYTKAMKNSNISTWNIEFDNNFNIYKSSEEEYYNKILWMWLIDNILNLNNNIKNVVYTIYFIDNNIFIDVSSRMLTFSYIWNFINGNHEENVWNITNKIKIFSNFYKFLNKYIK